MATAELVRKSPFDPPMEGARKEAVIVAKKLFLIALLFLAVYLFFVQSGRLMAGPSLLMIALGVVVFSSIDIVVGLAFFVGAIGVSPDSVGANNIRLEDYILPFLVILCVIKGRACKGDETYEDLFFKIKLYMVVALIATIKGLLIGTVWTQLIALQFYLKYVEYFVILWLGANTLKKRSDFIVLIISSFLVCGGVAYLAYSGREAMLESKSAYTYIRASGPQGETPNVMGGYYLIHIMMAFSLIFAVKNYLYKVVLIGFLVAVAVPLLYTYSRTSFSSVIVGIFVTCLFIDFRYLILVVLFVFCYQLLLPNVGSSVNVDATFIDRYSTIFEIFGDDDDKPSSWTARLVGWYIFYMKAWYTDPFFGRGVGSVGLGIDSSFVKKFVESGFLGSFTFLLILARLGRIALEVVRKVKDSIYRGIAVGYLGILVGICVHAVGVSSFSTIRTAEPFFLFSGVMMGVHYQVFKGLREKQDDLEEAKRIRFNA